MILSRAQLEDIGAAVINDFCGSIDGQFSAIDIDRLASDYLKLHVSFTRLSEDGSLCGITAYADTEFRLDCGGYVKTIPLMQNQVLLDSSFIEPSQCHKLCGKRRFTLSHECAHHILFQLETDEEKAACRRLYSARHAYSLRDLKTKEDWNEWQANVLGAAILMPPQLIDFLMFRMACSRRLVCYGNYFNYQDLMSLNNICRFLGVSKTALVIRLRELDFIEDKPYTEYRDPLEVWNEESDL